MLNNTSGSTNTALGNQAGSLILNGSNNTAVGYSAQVAVATNSNQVRIGDASVTKADIQVAWTITSDARYKKDIQNLPTSLPLIQALRPVVYKRVNDDNPLRVENGFIAQEVEATLQKMGLATEGIISKDDKGFYGVRYNDFIPVLVKGIQEQQKNIEVQEQKISDLQKQIDELKKLIGSRN